MALLRPKIFTRFGRSNEPVRVPLDNLLVDAVQTFLVTDIAAAVASLTVKNTQGFQINQVLLMGEPGNQNSEIVKTHASTVPTNTVITLASNTIRPHSSGTNLYLINFDQLEISSAATSTGSKTVLITTNISPGLIETVYNDTASTTGFYFARFKNTISSGFSSYSDAMPVAGYTVLMARSIIDNCLAQINKDQTGALIDEFFFHELNNFQFEVLRSLKRWSWMQSFDAIVTAAGVGYWKITVPSDMDDQNTNGSVYNLRLGREPQLTWVDKEKFNELIGDMAYSTLSSAMVSGASTVTLANSKDFDTSGTVSIGATSLTYSANNKVTGVLTLDDTIVTVYGVGVSAFQGESKGLPKYWTTYGGSIYHWPVVSSTYKNRNYYLDYYKALTSITTDTDAIVVPDPIMAQNYLCWKALRRLNNGGDSQESMQYRDYFLAELQRLKNKETMNRTFVLHPRFNNFSVQSLSNGGDSQKIRDGNFPDA